MLECRHKIDSVQGMQDVASLGTTLFKSVSIGRILSIGLP